MAPWPAFRRYGAAELLRRYGAVAALWRRGRRFGVTVSSSVHRAMVSSNVAARNAHKPSAFYSLEARSAAAPWRKKRGCMLELVHSLLVRQVMPKP